MSTTVQTHLNEIANECVRLHEKFTPMINGSIDDLGMDESKYSFYCHLDEIIDHVRAVQISLHLPPLQQGGQPAATIEKV
jgi:hypothetical protein